MTFLVSLLGNSLVIHVVRTTPSMYTSVNLYIANMAFSDIISAIVCTPVSLKIVFKGYSWIDGLVGLVLCRIVFLLFYSSFACSTFNLVAIAVDRYLAVTKPLYRYSFRKAKINIAVIWTASSILSIPIILGYVNTFKAREIAPGCYDIDRDKAYKVGVTIMALLCYIIPLVCATILYTMTGCRLRMRSKSNIGGYSLQRQIQAKQSAFKATKLMVTVIVVFALCWAPFFTYHMVKAWYDDKLWYIFKTYYRPLCFLLASTNGALNPCLYLLFNSNFRNGFKRALLCRKETGRRSMSFELRSKRDSTKQLR
ncbi:octopamine receptor 1-like [Actinia tenebrosa]|uniref:Octopamine receptor 1-like n=1 Tax=Actinia tenebrosa TaxID=6105 RepID=A0A6P8IZA8_ACTTE|nr:octopamine receptor 1-like [Actinia tenebrosa]